MVAKKVQSDASWLTILTVNTKISGLILGILDLISEMGGFSTDYKLCTKNIISSLINTTI